MRDSVNDEVQFAAQHADDLFMRMLMFGKPCTGIDIYPRMGDSIGMNQPRAETRKQFFHRHLIELNEWHAWQRTVRSGRPPACARGSFRERLSP